MNKRFISRPLSFLMAWWLLVSLTLPLARAVSGDTITIRTAAELQTFSKNCALDTWSQGKTAVLAADLDMTGVDFTPIPTFAGVFDGQGHTITGLRLTGSGSTVGLFRYIQPGATVRNLTVKGAVVPGGTRSVVGGIVGDNAGTLENCVFSGTVEGKSTVGGIAGRNSAAGQIIRCSTSGSVSGESATGGIAGRNLGLILTCVNSAGVNLTRTENNLDLKEVDAAALEERVVADDETYHLLNGCSDTGGIVGQSSGVVQSCTNNGAVGYPHVGYNTGGIAGRQSGYLAGCVNNGTINGRKDVGGIVGQMEPYLVMDPGQDTLERLRTELDTLNSLIERALDNAQRTGDDVSLRLETMGSFADDARESSKQLLDHVSDFTDENIQSVNTLAADVTNALDKISPALDDLSDMGRQVERLSKQLNDALDSLDGAVETGDQVIDDLRNAAIRLGQSQGQISAAAGELRQALDELYHVVFPEGESGPVQPAPEDVQAALERLRQAFDDLEKEGAGLEIVLSDLKQALDHAGPLSGQLRDVLEELQDATGTSSAIGRLMHRSFDTIGKAVDDLTRNGPTEFTPLGEDFRQSSDGLFNALSGLSDEMEGLHTAVQSGGDALNRDLRAINRQFNVVFDVVLDALTEVDDNIDEGIGAAIQDTSDEDIAATREGKVADCRNAGAVEGDRNVGGVAGAVAVEVDLDPEDDISDRLSFGATYETKAVLQSCLNYGSVTAKKDCVGGLAGRMDLGTALECQNYGPVTSTGGNYVGGVAGYAEASVRSCYTKNTLSGGSYVGGIAGWASHLRDCFAIATITEGEECLGAIAGGVETDGVLRDNRFVDTGTAGVDGVSYTGRACPIPFDELKQLPGVPQEFTAFTLTLMAQDTVVARIPFLYGEDLSRIDLPPVPEQEDSYGVWPEFDVSGVNSDLIVDAVYSPWITVAASYELSGRLALALVEGRFTEDVILHVTGSTQAPPPEVGEGGVVWNVALTGVNLGDQDPVPLRLLSPDGGKAAVWQYQDGQWQPVETVQNGQYLLLTMEGTRGTFCIQSRPGVSWVPMAALAIGAAVLIVLLAVFVKQKKKRGSKAQAEQEETAES